MVGLPSLSSITANFKMPSIPQFPNVGKILSLIGGAPIQHAEKHVVEMLKSAKNMIPGGGGMVAMMQQAMSGGMSSILQNPMAAISSQVNSAISSATSQLSSALTSSGGSLLNTLTLGGSSLGSALSGLTSTMGNLSTMTSLLSGVTMPTTGQFGIQDVINHSGIAQALGAALPSELSMANVLGPLTMSSQLTRTLSNLSTVTQGVIGGTISIDAAVAQLSVMSSSIQSVMDASNTALAGMQTLAPAIAQVSSVAAAVTSGAGGTALQSVLQTIVQPSVLAALKGNSLTSNPTTDVGPVAPGGTPDPSIPLPPARPADPIAPITPL